MQFSAIVSTYALSYVMLAYAPESEMDLILRKTLSHLKKGGYLLMTPMIPAGNATRARIQKYFAILETLRSEGEISDFNLVGDDANEKKIPLVIVK